MQKGPEPEYPFYHWNPKMKNLNREISKNIPECSSAHSNGNAAIHLKKSGNKETDIQGEK